jgi:hypothetical protein
VNTYTVSKKAQEEFTVCRAGDIFIRDKTTKNRKHNIGIKDENYV